MMAHRLINSAPELTTGHRSQLKSILAAGAGRLVALPVSAVFAFLTTRTIIQDAGADQYAVISLIISLSLLLPFGDLGLGATLVNQMSVSQTPGEDQAIHLVLLSSLRVLAAWCLAGLAVDGVITGCDMWPTLLGQLDKPAVNVATGLAMALFCLTMPLSLGPRMLLGMQKQGTATALQVLGAPVAYLVTTVSVTFGYGLDGLVVAAPLGMLTVSVVQLVYAHRKSGISLSGVVRLIPRTKRVRGVSIRKTAGPMLIITLALPLAFQTDRIILGHLAPISAVANYSLALQIYSIGWSLITACGMALWPVFAQARDRGGDRPSRTLRRALMTFTPVGVVAGGAIICLGPVLASVVGGTRVAVPPTLALAFGILLLIQTVQLPLGMFMTSEAGLRAQAVYVSLTVLVSVCGSIVLARAWGAPGPVVGSIIAVLVCQIVPGAMWSRRALRAYGDVMGQQAVAAKTETPA